MNVTLINPVIGRINNRKSYRKWVLEPLQFAALAAVTPKEINLEFYDERIEDINFDSQTNLVGISVETTTALRSYEISRIYREKGIPVIFGGFHPTLIPDEAIEHSDSIVIGQAENVWPKLLEDFLGGHLKKKYVGSPELFMEGYIPDKKIFGQKKYLPFSLIETGRGCIYGCDFCAVRQFFNKEYYSRKIENIIEEINISGKKNLLIVDDNIYSNKNHLEELCSNLIPLKINWASQASISICENDKLLDLIQKSGCKGLLVGLESLDDNNLFQMNKTANLKNKDFSKSLKKLRSRGIRVYGSFVIGYDNDTPNSINETLNFAISEKLAITNFYPLTPLPETLLYNRLKEEGRLINPQWWLDHNHQYGTLVFKPKNFSPLELKELCDKARRKFYSWNSIFLRSLDLESNLNSIYGGALFYIVNYLTRKEIFAKEKTFLGLENGED